MNNFFENAKNKFIITALVLFIGYLLTPKEWTTFATLLNTLGSLLLITGLFDVYLKKAYLNDLSQYIINGFFTKDDILKELRNEDIIKSIKNMINFLSLKLHSNLREKFKQRVSTYFIDIFNSDDNEMLHTFYEKYDLSIVINKISETNEYIETDYKLSYTLVNNSAKKIKHKIFKIRSVEKEFVSKTNNILELKELDIVVDDKKHNCNVSDYKTGEVPIPEDVTINNRDKVTAITLLGKDDNKPEISFKDTLEVTKHLIVKTKKDDIIYTCHFNRVASNIDVIFVDENATSIHILNGFAFIKKDNIEIKDIQCNNKKIKINDLVFPKDKIHFVSER